ncbi:MAG: FAD:protein FMN transferase [Myxococcales bacterium]|nr:MAG: FAD:protein FMN transferase [Myxococcales bacterium]
MISSRPGATPRTWREWRFGCLAAGFTAALCLSCSSPSSPSAEKTPENSKPSIAWFEQEDTVFYGIPSRVLFALPEGTLAEKADRLKSAVTEAYDLVDRRFNNFKDTSEIGAANAAAERTELAVSPEFLDALKVARDVYQRSGGAFDPTVQPFKTLWNKAKETQALPTEAELAAAAARVGFDKTSLKQDVLPTLARPAGLSFDFGGLAKGYAVDLIVKSFKSAGVQNALVQCGGEIRAWGHNKDGEPWGIGVQHPTRLEAIYGSMRLDGDWAFSTSGNYRQPIRIGGQPYYHIFDPKTGRPISTDILGVTVLLRGGEFANATADAWATALAVIGAEKGVPLAEANGVDALYILKSEADPEGMRPVMTRDFAERFTQSAAPAAP